MATGHTPSRRHPEYWGGAIPWINVGDARPCHGKTIHATTENVNEIGLENSAAVLLPAGTVCLSRTGSIGYTVILGRPMATSQGFVNWICGPRLLPQFLQLIFVAENSFLHEISEGVAHTTIYFPEAKAFHVCLPSVEVQTRIVAEIETQFSRLDQGLDGLSRNRRRLSEFRSACLHTIFQPHVAGQTRSLEQVCEVISGFAFKSVDFVGEGVPAIKIANVGFGSYLTKDQDYLPLAFEESHAGFSVKPGDLLLALTRPITANTLKVCAYPEGSRSALLNQRVAILRLASKRDADFLLAYMHSPQFKRCVQDSMSQTLQPNLSPVDLRRFAVPWPEVTERARIVAEVDRRLSIVRGVEAQVEANLKRAQALRQAVLNKAFALEA